MSDIQIIMFMIGGLGVMMLTMAHFMNNNIEKLSIKIDKLDEKVTDIDRRLCRLEGAFSKQDCCVLKDHRNVASE